MSFYSHCQLSYLASSILVITTGVLVQSGQKSLAQFANSPAPAGVTSINGAGATSVSTLFVGVAETFPYPFGSKGSWFNVYGVGNQPRLNDDVPPQPSFISPSIFPIPNGSYGPVTTLSTFRYAGVGSSAGLRAFFNQGVPAELVDVTPQPTPAPTPPVRQPIVFSGSPGVTRIDATNSILRPISFADTDAPLAGTDIERIVTGTPNRGKAIQVPVVGVGIALAYNPTGLTRPVAGLRLSRRTYCAILNGSITNWNDARIRADNAGLVVSANRPLRVVRRSDGSGTTFALSRHLNAACKIPGAAGVPAGGGTPGLPASAVWNRGVGTNSVPLVPAPVVPPGSPTIVCNPRGARFSPQFVLPPPNNTPTTIPTNTVCWWADAATNPTAIIAASGDGGVANAIANTPGAIGYVDSATRLTRNLPAAVLQNKAGNYIAISSTSISSALSGGTIVRYGLAPANRLIRIDGLVDPTVSTAYPISTASYLLFYDTYANITIASGIRQFISWALANAPQPIAFAFAPNSNSSNPTPDQIAISRGYAPLPNSIKTVSRTVVNTCVNTVVNASPCIP